MKKQRMQIGVGDVKIPSLAKQYVGSVLKSERLTYGKFTAEFERKFAKIHNVRYVIFCNSGTSALQVALHSLKKHYQWNDGDEIIVPALTFVATVNVVFLNNLKPVFVDVEPRYFEIDPARIEKKITDKTRAILPVHIGGHPADMDPILKIARKYKLKVIEDSCETMFAKYNGRSVGSFGDVACFSTYAAHIIVTGVGGFVCTNNRELAIRAKSLINQGRDGIYISIDDDNIKDKNKLFQIVERRFNFIDVGYSYRTTEFESALGLAQLKNWKKGIEKRKYNAQYLNRGLMDLSSYLELPKERAGSEHVYMFYPLIVRKGVKRDDLVFFLEENGIETRFLLPLLSQPIYKKILGNLENKYPVAKHLSENGFYIGSHPSLRLQELDYIIGKFHEFFNT